ncbi:LLM class flavin-dependent oxidoreductase [Agromyces sp. CFH 90414]|uniref:LLM class flavin-dependent oxidoreductase n=1 Tax=Agromyces agglutinans TaxID=2662258 RepID=A0A6I2FJW6_9MICO|nr:LLM class flavin-dependent oxidoreductase [Agromyces agglutinans]MRG60978.1 LLM class flavin-dependent oxidoreductase [Agromyces agglutinans]
MTHQVEFGLDTFGDVTLGADGTPLSQAQVLRNVVAEAELADRLGLDFFGVGEHHRHEFAVSAPEVVLAAIASRTERIRLGSAVTVLSSDDPVRVYQRFATLDGLSGGRAEVILGRGSFIESFPLFGYDLSRYQELFEEKLELFAALLPQEPVTWSGALRPALTDQSVYPRLEHGPLTTWIGVGGSPESVVRTARYGLPLVLAIIGGSPARFAPLADLYRRALEQFGHAEQPIAIHSPGFVAATDQEALDTLWPHYQVIIDRIGRERGWGATTREHFENEAAHGALYAGSPETVAQKIAAAVRAIGARRFDLKYSNGTLPHEAMLSSIERYATEVVPRVRELLAADEADAADSADAAAEADAADSGDAADTPGAREA